jgi:hypothetical protein
LVLHVGGARDKRLERPEQPAQVEEERDEVARRAVALEDAATEEEQDGDRRERDEDLPEDLEPARPPPGADLLSRHEVAAGGEAGVLGGLAREAADDAHAREDLGALGVEPLPRGADVAVHGADAPDPCAVAEPDDGQEDERRDEHAPVDEREDDERARELRDRAPRVVDEREDQVADAARVLAQHARGAARLDRLDPVQRQMSRVVEDASPRAHLHALDQPRALPAPPHPDEDSEHGRRKDHAADDVEERFTIGRDPRGQRLGGGVGQDVVEDEFRGVRREQPERRGDRERDERRGERAPVAG